MAKKRDDDTPEAPELAPVEVPADPNVTVLGVPDDRPDRPRVKAPAPGEDEPPRWDENGNLTHHGATKAVKEGGSVLLGDRLISRLEDLPDEAEFAKGNERAEKALAASLDAQLATLAAQRAKLGGGKKGKGE